MSATNIIEVSAEACTCALWDGTSTTVRFCAEHHAYHLGMKPLVSVSRILRETWPIKPSWDGVDMAVIENARDRGIVTDALFSAYVIGGLDRIPAGTRKDAVALFGKLRKWWDGIGHLDVRSQVLLTNGKEAGTCDVLADRIIYDAKSTYSLELSYHLQLGGYGDLYETMEGEAPEGMRIVQVTERLPEPLITTVKAEAIDHWRLLRDTWRMAQGYK